MIPLWIVFTALVLAWGAPAQETFPNMIGVDLGSLDARGGTFVDAAKTLRPFEGLQGGNVPKDAHGWPLSDAKTVFFDQRPTMAWNPPIDDPEAYQVDMSGTYKLSFTGQADLSSAGGKLSIGNPSFDPGTNTTTADLTVPGGEGLMIVAFKNTRLTPSSPLGSGFKDVKLIRPGYPPGSGQIVTTAFVETAGAFPYFRCMNWLSTNNNAPFDANGPVYQHWTDRKQVLDATQLDDLGKMGVAWEFIIELGNTTGKDLWINIPVAADDDYILELAKLMHAQLDQGIDLYLEYSNEVWNWGFMQSVWNKIMAEEEVQSGNSNLNYDGDSSIETIRRRRHARRTLEILTIFAGVFGSNEINQRLKAILPWWTGAGSNGYKDMLTFIEDNYGPPNQFFYAIGTTGYFDYKDSAADPNDTVADVLDKMEASLAGTGAAWPPFNSLAKSHGLKHVVYEGGDNTSPDLGAHTIALASRIKATRHSRMGELIDDLIRKHWFGQGGGEADLFTYFTLCSAYSRYGTWGLTDDINIPNRNFKYPAAMILLGESEPTLFKDGWKIPVTLPTAIRFTVGPGAAYGGFKYLILGGASGMHPGFDLPGGLHVPLNIDTATLLMLSFMNTPPFSKFYGVLDGMGEAGATFSSSAFIPIDPHLVGESLYFCAVVWPDGQQYVLTTNVKMSTFVK
jgi:hypothetical protein